MTKEPAEQVEKGNPWYTDDQITSSESPWQRRVIADRTEFILGTVDDCRRTKAPPLRVLDAGCGDGTLLKVLIHLGGLSVYGIDYNALRVGRARENAPEAVVMRGLLEDLYISHDFFDIVILSQVLEHIKEDARVLESLTRVLKPDGILILGVPNEGCFLAQLRNRYLERSISKTTDHVNFYTEKTIRGKIAEAGLTITNTKRTGFFFPHQMLNVLLSSTSRGYKLMQVLGRLIPSQVACFYFVCRKKND